MAFYIGSRPVAAAYIGSKTISQAYLGASPISGAGGPVFDRPQVMALFDNSNGKGSDYLTGYPDELAARDAFRDGWVPNPKIQTFSAADALTTYLPGILTGRQAQQKTDFGSVAYEIGPVEAFQANFPLDNLYIIKGCQAGSAGGLNADPAGRGSFTAGIVAGANQLSSVVGTPVVNRHIIAPGLEDGIVMTTTGSPPTGIRKLGQSGLYNHAAAIAAPTTFQMYLSTSGSMQHGSLWQGNANNPTSAARSMALAALASIQASTGKVPELRLIVVWGPGNDADYDESAPRYVDLQSTIDDMRIVLAPYMTGRTVFAIRRMPRSVLSAGAVYDRETTVINGMNTLKANNPDLRLVYAGPDGVTSDPAVAAARPDGVHDSIMQQRTVVGPGMFAVGWQGAAGI